MRPFPIFIMLVLVLLAASVVAQEAPLESRVNNLERELNDRSGGAALYLFGAFCALWAQNTGRNAWLWFFMGLLFSVIAVLVLLSKNATDLRARVAQQAAPA
jgi:hypothetical protein